MATPTFNRNVKNIKNFGAGVIMLAENDNTGAQSGQWAQFEIAKEMTISQEVEEVDEVDDTGKPVTTTITTNKVMGEGMILSRDESVRQAYMENSTQAFKGKKFRVAVIGALLDDNGTDKYEVWFFPSVTFSSAFTYGLGTSDAKIPYKFSANPVKGTDLTFNLPTGDAWTGLITTTGSVTIEVGEYFNTLEMA